jgi:hypothetical protein
MASHFFLEHPLVVAFTCHATCHIGGYTWRTETMQNSRYIDATTARMLYSVVASHFVRALYFVDGCEHIQRRIQR